MKKIVIPKQFQVLFIPLGFVLVNLIWKFLSVNVMPIDHDEPFTIFYSQMSIFKMYPYLSGGENNPLFFESILHFWTKLFGVSILSVRFLSVLFSSFTVYFLYQLCYRNFSFKAAVVASFIFTCSNYHLGFSHEARTYAMFAFFTTVSMYCFFELIRNPERKKNWIWLGVVNLLLVYSHFFALFIPFVQLVVSLSLSDLRKNVLKKFLYASIITLVGYIPMLYILVPRFISSAGKGTWVQPATFNELNYVFSCITNKKNATAVSILILVVAGVIVLDKKGFKVRSQLWTVLAWFCIPFFFMYVISLESFPFTIPMFIDRYLIHTSIPMYILIALGLVQIADVLSRKWVKWGIYLVFAFIMLRSVHWPVDENKMPQVVETVNQKKTDNTVIYLAPGYYILNFCSNYDYSYFKNVPDVEPFENLVKKLGEDKIFPIYNGRDVKKDLIAENKRVIYIDLAAKVLFPDNAILDSLKQNAVRVEQVEINRDRDVWIFDY